MNNVTSKTLLASTLFIALITGTSAFATDDRHRSDFEDTVKTESVVIQKVSMQSTANYSDNTVLSSRK